MAKSLYRTKCENCGADIPIIAGRMDMRCEYCGGTFPVPEEMLKRADKSRKYQEFQENARLSDEMKGKVNEAFRGEQRLWKGSLILWIVLSVIFITFSDTTGSNAMEEIAMSFFIFGLCYIIAAKPKRIHYQLFQTSEQLEEYLSYIKKWRGGFLIWVFLVSILYGIGESLGNDLGTGTLLGGIFLLAYFRPSKKFRDVIPKEHTAGRKKRR